MKKFLLLAFFMSLMTGIMAQTITVTGTVTSADDDSPVIGGSVAVKGTATGTTTDLDGNFSIEVNSDAILSFSSVGFIAEDVSIAGQTVINVKLVPDLVDVDEVIVIGYGTQRKSDLTGAVVSLKAEEISKTGTMGIHNAIQGKAAGVQIINDNGTPGSTPIVRIRGIGTLNDANPIYVIDGMILHSAEHVNLNDVESVEILKDASATAIYGVKGANGVILITTKKGKKGKPVFEIRTEVGVAQVANTPEMANADEYRILVNEAYENDGRTFRITSPDTILPTDSKGTNWYDEVYQLAFTQNYQFSASQSSERVNYHIGANYINTEGIVPQTGMERISIRANNEYFLSKHLSLGHNLNYIRTDRDRGPDPTRTAYSAPPIYIPFREGDEEVPYGALGTVANPFLERDNNNDSRREKRYVGNFYVKAKLAGFVFRSSYGFENNDMWTTDYKPVFTHGPYAHNRLNDRIQSELDKELEFLKNHIWDNTLDFSRDIKHHRLGIMIGHSRTYTYQENYDTQARDLPDIERLWFLDANLSSTAPTVENNAYDNATISYMGRINYSYRGKYLFTGTIRRDGSSKFGSGKKWGNFPSLALGWNLHEEAFMQNVSLINRIKIRGSWGIIGNDKIDNYAHSNFLTTTEEVSGDPSAVVAILGPDETPMAGVTFVSIADPDIHWEETQSTDIGLEIGILDNRLSAEIGYYNKVTTDILRETSIPGYFGSTEPTTVNAASVVNRGLEILLNWKDNMGDFNYDITANFSTIYNEVLEIVGNQDEIIGNTERFNFTRTYEGSSIGEFWGYKVDGVYQTPEQIAASPQDPSNPPEVGDYIYRDISGRDADGELTNVPDSVIRLADDMTGLGSPIPDLIYGFTVNMGYKGFDFSMDINGQVGGKIATGRARVRAQDDHNFEKRFMDRWTPENQTNEYSRVVYGDNYNTIMNDRWLQDATYLRIRNIQFGYTLPVKWSGKLLIKKLRAFVNVNNLYTFTKYTGSSPDVTRGDMFLNGVDMTVYPASRTYTLGLSLTF